LEHSVELWKWVTEDLSDYGVVANSYTKNRTNDVTASKVNWLHIKCLQYNKNS